jgi:hypothetical protein
MYRITVTTIEANATIIINKNVPLSDDVIFVIAFHVPSIVSLSIAGVIFYYSSFDLKPIADSFSSTSSIAFLASFNLTPSHLINSQTS